jgi:hypothetical protein
VDRRLHDRVPDLTPERFNPLKNEGDAFRVVLWVAAVCFAIAALVLIGRAVL